MIIPGIVFSSFLSMSLSSVTVICQPVFIQILNNQLHIIYLLNSAKLGMLLSLLLIGEDTDS